MVAFWATLSRFRSKYLQFQIVSSLDTEQFLSPAFFPHHIRSTSRVSMRSVNLRHVGSTILPLLFPSVIQLPTRLLACNNYMYRHMWSSSRSTSAKLSIGLTLSSLHAYEVGSWHLPDVVFSWLVDHFGDHEHCTQFSTTM